MAATRVGAVTPTATSTTPQVPGIPQAATVGNLLIMSIGIRRSAAVTSVTTPSGWTADTNNGESTNGTIHFGTYVFWKFATGSGDDPSVAWVGDTAEFGMEEWSGLSSHDVDGSSVGLSTTVNGATINAPCTPTGAGLVFTIHGALSNGAGATTSFGGGSATDLAFARSATSAAFLTTGTQLVAAAGAVTPTATLASGGTAGQRAHSMSFLLSAGPTQKAGWGIVL